MKTTFFFSSNVFYCLPAPASERFHVFACFFHVFPLPAAAADRRRNPNHPGAADPSISQRKKKKNARMNPKSCFFLELYGCCVHFWAEFLNWIYCFVIFYPRKVEIRDRRCLHRQRQLLGCSHFFFEKIMNYKYKKGMKCHWKMYEKWKTNLHHPKFARKRWKSALHPKILVLEKNWHFDFWIFLMT